MKKISSILGALVLGLLLLPNSTSALSPIPLDPINPIDPNPIPVETGIKMPKIDPQIVFDPILIPDEPEIDLGNLKPIPLEPIVIPPEFFKGPEISNVQVSSDGEIIQVTWNTNKAATSKVAYGTTQNYDKALEDLNLKTSHAFVFPVTAGTWHLQVSSQDSLKRETQTSDFLVVVAQTQDNKAPTETEEGATDTKDPADESPGEILTNTPPVAAPETSNQTATELPLPAETEAKPVMTTMEIIFGGLALLLAGALIGILVNRAKPKAKQE